MRIERLDHLVLTVADVETTVAWYVAVLGMRPVRFGGGRTALRFGDQKINLHAADEIIEPRAKAPTRGSADLCLIFSGAIEDAVDHLAECEVSIEEGPVARAGAAGAITSVYVRDPDANLVEIATYGDLESRR